MSNLTLPVFAVAISLSVVLAVPKRLSLPLLPPPRPFHSASSESSAVEFASVVYYLRDKRTECHHKTKEGTERNEKKTEQSKENTQATNKLRTDVSPIQTQTHCTQNEDDERVK